MSDETTVPQPTEHIALATAGQRQLLERLDALLATGSLDVTAPSRLPEWTIGHVITHVANSGDGHLRMLDAAAAGHGGLQYPGGREQRRSDINTGATRPAAVQVEALRATCAALVARWGSMPAWTGRGTAMIGDVAVADLPFMRTREVEIHHIDLGIGRTFADLPAAYLREELRRMEMLWAARQPMGRTALPPAALAVPPPERLAWLMGRTTIDGLEPARIF